MIISEFLPNPVGKDTDAEFIELFNDSGKGINLIGWRIKDASGKVFVFKNQKITAGEYLALNYKTTKITLNNDAETIFLYDPSGNLVDKVGFSGAAPAGKSFACPVRNAVSNGVRQNNLCVLTSKPTPGKVNILEIPTSSLASAEVLTNSSAININPSISLNGLWIGFFIALILAGLSVFILREFGSASD